MASHDAIGVMQSHLYWCQYHGLQTTLSMSPYHSLCQDDQNKVQHDLFGQVMPLALALALCDTDGIISGTTAFLRS